nr:MAG TPA: hypothetical protein [Caudoviricetes sp.]
MIIFTKRKKEILIYELKDKLSDKNLTLVNISGGGRIEYEDLGVKNTIKILLPNDSSRGHKDNIVLYDGSLYDYTEEEYCYMCSILRNDNIQQPMMLYPYSHIDYFIQPKVIRFLEP